MSAHDVRDQHKHNFVFTMLGIGLREQVLQDWNVRQTRNSAQRLGLLVFQNSAQQVDLAFLQADFMLDLALPDHRLVNAADIGVAGYSRYIQRNL